ncbi:MAG: ribonuclease Z, partial [bacterium]
PDLLIHEAMFLEKHDKHAREKGHSTAREAGEVANRLNADQLWLVHASRRYDHPQVLEQEARNVFENVQLAKDHMETTI